MPTTNQVAQTMHHNLNIILDQYRRAFTLKKVFIDQYIIDNIQQLRTIIEQTENADVLFSEFKRKILEMKTWKESWRWMTGSDCALQVYTYMLPIIDGLSKEHVIKQLRAEKIALQHNIHVIENRHAQEIMNLERNHESEIKKHTHERIKAEKVSSVLLHEIKLLKEAQLIQESRIMEGQQRLDDLVVQNIQLLDQMQAMQELIRPTEQVDGRIRATNQAADAKPSSTPEHHTIAISGI